MKHLLLILAAVAGFALPSPARAYWDYGHEVVAAIAWKNVTPGTRAAIARLLAHSDLLGTPECPARTIEQASTWAECIKTLSPRFDHAYSWHYQDADICRPFDLKPACKDGNCVSAQIERDVKLLKDRRAPLGERVQALVFLIHLVGDLHQPLHTATHGEDHGGTKIQASYGIFAPANFTLHFVWDGPLTERAVTTGPSLVRAYSAAEKAPVQAGTIADWGRESWQVARDTVYARALGGDPCGPAPERVRFDEAAIEPLIVPARRQVLRGGLRLARLLDETLGSANVTK